MDQTPAAFDTHRLLALTGVWMTSSERSDAWAGIAGLDELGAFIVSSDGGLTGSVRRKVFGQDPWIERFQGKRISSRFEALKCAMGAAVQCNAPFEHFTIGRAGSHSRDRRPASEMLGKLHAKIHEIEGEEGFLHEFYRGEVKRDKRLRDLLPFEVSMAGILPTGEDLEGWGAWS